MLKPAVVTVGLVPQQNQRATARPMPCLPEGVGQMPRIPSLKKNNGEFALPLGIS